ncbi:hypothetical protein [Tabrizicola sp.]|uniref:hypothetical protein n=1 Tax=Tabrizicola sp. TaxID=2005166 RepID=UPI003F3C2432
MPMWIKALISLLRPVLFSLLTVALIATGYGHRMPTPQDQALALALANGATIADFCGDEAGGGAKGGLHCLACQIAATANLPSAQPTVVALELAFHAAVIAPRESRALQRVLDPANSPQGPPVA